MYFSKWVIEYHFPVKLFAGLAYFSGIILTLLGKQDLGIIAILVSSLAWWGMDFLTDYVRDMGIDIGDTVEKIQAFGGVWAVIVAAGAIGIRFYKIGVDATSVISGAVLISLMIFQVRHEYRRAKSGRKDSKKVDWVGSSASYMQQLIPVVLWIVLQNA